MNLGKRIQDLGFGIWDLGFGIWDSGFGIWDSGLSPFSRCCLRRLGFRIRDSGNKLSLLFESLEIYTTFDLWN